MRRRIFNYKFFSFIAEKSKLRKNPAVIIFDTLEELSKRGFVKRRLGSSRKIFVCKAKTKI